MVLLPWRECIRPVPVVWKNPHDNVERVHTVQNKVYSKKEKAMRIAIAIVSLIVLCGGLGCAALSNLVTPAEIDRQAVDYAVGAGVADLDDYDGYGNLVKAAKLKADVAKAHQTIQLDLQQQAEKDSLTYASLNDTVTSNYAAAVNREETLFGTTGLLSLGLTAAGLGTLTGMIGLMRKRPGDVTSAEMEQAVDDVAKQAGTEVTAKQRQIMQLVQGISEYMKTLKDAPVSLESLKTVLSMTQDTDTQLAVDTVKRELNL